MYRTSPLAPHVCTAKTQTRRQRSRLPWLQPGWQSRWPTRSAASGLWASEAACGAQCLCTSRLVLKHKHFILAGLSSCAQGSPDICFLVLEQAKGTALQDGKVPWVSLGRKQVATHRVLHVHDHGDRQQRAQVDRQVKPVEEAVLVLAILHADAKNETSKTRLILGHRDSRHSSLRFHPKTFLRFCNL